MAELIGIIAHDERTGMNPVAFGELLHAVDGDIERGVP